MRYKEIKPLQEQNLFEINMSPKSLEQLASKISARAGLEFEMIVPNAENSNSDDYESEPDYEMDESVSDIDDAVRFFFEGDYNSRDDVDRLRRDMMRDYEGWYNDKIGERWDDDGEQYLTDYIRDNVSSDEWEREGEDEEAAFEEFVNEQWKNRGRYYDDAREEFEQEYGDDYGQSEWLEYENINTMMDVEDNYNITWPYTTNANDGSSGRTTAEVADSFDNYLGRGVKVGGYHSVNRNTSAYIVEPDGSLEPDDSDDAGLEFVSPPLTIPEMIEDLKKVAAWAEDEGCYTNDSTGLHMNISVENFDKENIDYIKLAVLCGDEYILKEFGRMGNTYAASAIGKVKDIIKHKPERARELLDQMKSHLEQGADKAVESTTRNIHGNYTNKYTSINLKDNRIEFRSPGGDWLGEYRKDPGKLVNTMLRFVVALDAAMDPNKYRKEYLTKLYKLLNPKGQQDEYGEMIEQFAKYVTGVGGAPEQVVKNFRRLATYALQQGRKATVGEPQAAEPDNPNYVGIRSSVNRDQFQRDADGNVLRFPSVAAALSYIRSNGLPEPEWRISDLNMVEPELLRRTPVIRDTPAFDQRQLSYEVFDREDPEQNTIEVIHGTINQIVAKLDLMSRIRNIPRTRLGIRNIGHTATGPEAGSGHLYNIFRGMDTSSVVDTFMARNDQEAIERLSQYQQAHPGGEYNVGPAPGAGANTPAANSSPQQPGPPGQASASNGVPLWEVYERDSGRVVFTFPDHNQQSAWSTAQAWARANVEPAEFSNFSLRPKMYAQ